jgi:predicted RNA-binding Zn-ribbon protein involved in translation (DUF1610 family)
MTTGIIKLCKCKKQRLALDEYKISEPCPDCGRRYKCYHKGYTLKTKEVYMIKRFIGILIKRLTK